MNIYYECPLPNKVEEHVNYIFISYYLAFKVWATIDTHRPTPINTTRTICLNIFGIIRIDTIKFT